VTGLSNSIATVIRPRRDNENLSIPRGGALPWQDVDCGLPDRPRRDLTNGRVSPIILDRLQMARGLARLPIEDRGLRERQDRRGSMYVTFTRPRFDVRCDSLGGGFVLCARRAS
jgi:hypothetical protein